MPVLILDFWETCTLISIVTAQVHTPSAVNKGSFPDPHPLLLACICTLHCCCYCCWSWRRWWWWRWWWWWWWWWQSPRVEWALGTVLTCISLRTKGASSIYLPCISSSEPIQFISLLTNWIIWFCLIFCMSLCLICSDLYNSRYQFPIWYWV
jgi:hypothetical protein